MERPDFVKRADVARLIPVVADTSREQRAASVLLAALRGVHEFRQQMLASLGVRVGSRAALGAWTEIVLEAEPDAAKNDRPDGLLVLKSGRKTWTALIEAKIGNAEVGEEQLKQYLFLKEQIDGGARPGDAHRLLEESIANSSAPDVTQPRPQLLVLIAVGEGGIEIGHHAHEPPGGVRSTPAGAERVKLRRGSLLVPLEERVGLGIHGGPCGDGELAPGPPGALAGDDRPQPGQRIEPELRQAASPSPRAVCPHRRTARRRARSPRPRTCPAGARSGGR